MKNIKLYISTLFISFFFISGIALAQKKKGACCAKSCSDKGTFSLGDMKNVPNAKLVNQYGKDVQFYDLIKGKVVALNFVFTTCKTICPPMGANFVALQEKLSDKVASKELVMLTISIDPVNDTPERLFEWSQKFEPQEGWTLLTGEKTVVDNLLKSLEVYTALKDEHAPILLFGKEGEGKWTRTNGLASPDELAKGINPLFKKIDRTGATIDNPDEHYFTNVKLINQNGEEKRLYADLMQDKIVIINPFFAQCKGVCPVLNGNMESIQSHLGEKVGKEISMLSITVDPINDTPEVLKVYSAGFNAKNGWNFLTGTKENVDMALHKFGKKVEDREAHDSVIIVGNLKTKLWKKVNGLASIEEILKVVDSVVDSEVEQ